MPSEPIKMLFVCLGNICRSPLAEAIFQSEARRRGVQHLFEVDSAGTSSYHVGAPPDRRSVATASRRGVEVVGSARQLTHDDLVRFDYVIAMDEANFADVQQLRTTAGGAARVHRLREWDPEGGDLDVPDPYYGGSRGFEDVHDLVERSCAALLDDLLRQHGEDGE